MLTEQFGDRLVRIIDQRILESEVRSSHEICQLPGALKPGGRAAILTFHSGEDKLVKKALKEGYKAGVYADYSKDVIRPSAQECVQNGRARSTKMRWAIKAEG